MIFETPVGPLADAHTEQLEAVELQYLPPKGRIADIAAGDECGGDMHCDRPQWQDPRVQLLHLQFRRFRGDLPTRTSCGVAFCNN